MLQDESSEHRFLALDILIEASANLWLGLQYFPILSRNPIKSNRMSKTEIRGKNIYPNLSYHIENFRLPIIQQSSYDFQLLPLREK